MEFAKIGYRMLSYFLVREELAKPAQQEYWLRQLIVWQIIPLNDPATNAPIALQ
jgi:hypothetical protein